MHSTLICSNPTNNWSVTTPSTLICSYSTNNRSVTTSSTFICSYSTNYWSVTTPSTLICSYSTNNWSVTAPSKSLWSVARFLLVYKLNHQKVPNHYDVIRTRFIVRILWPRGIGFSLYVCMYCLRVKTVKVRFILRLGEPIGFQSGPNMNKDSWTLFLTTTALPYGGHNYWYWFSFYSKSNEMQQLLKFISFLGWQSTCFGRSFRPSPGVQDCTYSNRFISVFNQLDAQNLLHNKFYFMPLGVSSTCAHHQEVKIALHSLWYHHRYRWPSRARDGHHM